MTTICLDSNYIKENIVSIGLSVKQSVIWFKRWECSWYNTACLISAFQPTKQETFLVVYITQMKRAAKHNFKNTVNTSFRTRRNKNEIKACRKIKANITQ